MAKQTKKINKNPVTSTNITIKKVQFEKKVKQGFEKIDKILITIIVILTIALMIVKLK